MMCPLYLRTEFVKYDCCSQDNCKRVFFSSSEDKHIIHVVADWCTRPRNLSRSPAKRDKYYATVHSAWHAMMCYAMLRYGMTIHGMTWHDMTWHDMTWHDMTWHDVVRHDLAFASQRELCEAIARRLTCKSEPVIGLTSQQSALRWIDLAVWKFDPSRFSSSKGWKSAGQTEVPNFSTQDSFSRRSYHAMRARGPGVSSERDRIGRHLVEEEGFAIVDDFLPPDVAKELRKAMMEGSRTRSSTALGGLRGCWGVDRLGWRKRRVPREPAGCRHGDCFPSPPRPSP